MKDRIQHNNRYKDDTIFDNLDIFKDVPVERKPVSNKKDSFDARNLLAKRFEDITDKEHFIFKDDHPSIAYKDNSEMSLMSLCKSNE